MISAFLLKVSPQILLPHLPAVFFGQNNGFKLFIWSNFAQKTIYFTPYWRLILRRAVAFTGGIFFAAVY